MADDFPKIVSVDDHVIEPPHVWQDRLPQKYKDVGPRIERHPLGEMTFIGGKFTHAPGTDGDPCDWWHYEDKLLPHTRLAAAVGFDRDDVKITAITYEEMRKGCWDPAARVADMDVNWTEAPMCFPSFPRFCGQTFLEASDHELALLCVQAYNDWMVDEWCGGVAPAASSRCASSRCGTPRSPPTRCGATPPAGVRAVCVQRDPAVPRAAVHPLG